MEIDLNNKVYLKCVNNYLNLYCFVNEAVLQSLQYHKVLLWLTKYIHCTDGSLKHLKVLLKSPKIRISHIINELGLVNTKTVWALKDCIGRDGSQLSIVSFLLPLMRAGEKTQPPLEGSISYLHSTVSADQDQWKRTFSEVVHKIHCSYGQGISLIHSHHPPFPHYIHYFVSHEK